MFKFAAELAYLECGDLLDKLVDEGNFTSDASRSLARLGLANYFAAATVLPYGQFHDVAEEFRYDIERLSAFFSQSYETICHRLSTLQRPKQRGVPFSFVRVDRAGNMSKRQSATGFHFSSSGGTCPLWNVYESFAYPGKIMTQIAQMPDGRSYLWVARTVERRAARYGQPGKTFAIGLGCELRHAGRGVYADALDLDDGDRHPDRRRLPRLRADQLPAARLPAARQGHRHQRAPQLGLAVPDPLSRVTPPTTAECAVVGASPQWRRRLHTRRATRSPPTRAAASAFTSPLATLPPGAIGSWSTVTTCSGMYSRVTPFAASQPVSSAVGRSEPSSVTTTAQTFSPNSSSSTPTTETSTTAGCARTNSSTSTAEMFLPPRMMMSALRPTTAHPVVPVDLDDVAEQHPAVVGVELAVGVVVVPVAVAHQRPVDAGLAAAQVSVDLGTGIVEHPHPHVVDDVPAGPQPGLGSSSTVVTLTAPVSLEP